MILQISFIFFLIAFQACLHLIHEGCLIHGLRIKDFLIHFLPDIPRVSNPHRIGVEAIALIIGMLESSTLIVPLPVLMLFEVLNLALVPRILFIISLAFGSIPFCKLEKLVLHYSLLF